MPIYQDGKHTFVWKNTQLQSQITEDRDFCSPSFGCRTEITTKIPVAKNGFQCVCQTFALVLFAPIHSPCCNSSRMSGFLKLRFGKWSWKVPRWLANWLSTRCSRFNFLIDGWLLGSQKNHYVVKKSQKMSLKTAFLPSLRGVRKNNAIRWSHKLE